MIGRTNKDALSGAAIPGAFSKMARPIWTGGDAPMQRLRQARRLAGPALLTAVTIALTISPAFGLKRSSAPASAPAGVSAETVNKAEQHLSEVGYWAGPAADKAADRARCAILAFQRVERRHQTGKLDATDVQAALAAARPIPRETGYSHVEVDLQRQVLFVVDQNIGVRLVVPISSGSGKLYTFEGKTSRAVTPRDRFTVYRKVAGWRKAPLGMIYYPNYFDEGWAIHGSGSVPNYPASHGCIRIPIATAKELSDITPVGTVVLVYDGSPGASEARLGN